MVTLFKPPDHRFVITVLENKAAGSYHAGHSHHSHVARENPMPGAIRLHITPVLYLALLAAVMAVAVVVAMRYGGTVHSGALVSHARPAAVFGW
jgi:hypothetical protein